MQENFLKIVSLNIEGDKHLDRILSFLKRQKADAVLLQEVFSKDISQFENSLGMKGIFAPMKILSHKGAKHKLGLTIFSSAPIINHHCIYYRGDPKNLPIIEKEDPLNDPLKTARAILGVEVRAKEKIFCLISTHFTWTPDGQTSDLQQEDLPKLLTLLSQFPQFIFCGDLNAPRGKFIFNKIASVYKDNIPSSITTTIDKHFHRAGDLQLVVDCLFSTPQYLVKEIEVCDYLSDHCAIVAKIA